jgi:hypothetical protein
MTKSKRGPTLSDDPLIYNKALDLLGTNLRIIDIAKLLNCSTSIINQIKRGRVCNVIYYCEHKIKYHICSAPECRLYYRTMITPFRRKQNYSKQFTRTCVICSAIFQHEAGRIRDTCSRECLNMLISSKGLDAWQKRCLKSERKDSAHSLRRESPPTNRGPQGPRFVRL